MHTSSIRRNYQNEMAESFGCDEQFKAKQEDLEDISVVRSIIHSPEMIFSTEEVRFLNQLNTIHRDLPKKSMSFSLLQSKIKHYLGHLSRKDLDVQNSDEGRKSMNFYHLQSMNSQPYFSELTIR